MNASITINCSLHTVELAEEESTEEVAKDNEESKKYKLRIADYGPISKPSKEDDDASQKVQEPVTSDASILADLKLQHSIVLPGTIEELNRILWTPLKVSLVEGEEEDSPVLGLCLASLADLITTTDHDIEEDLTFKSEETGADAGTVTFDATITLSDDFPYSWDALAILTVRIPRLSNLPATWAPNEEVQDNPEPTATYNVMLEFPINEEKSIPLTLTSNTSEKTTTGNSHVTTVRFDPQQRLAVIPNDGLNAMLKSKQRWRFWTIKVKRELEGKILHQASAKVDLKPLRKPGELSITAQYDLITEEVKKLESEEASTGTEQEKPDESRIFEESGAFLSLSLGLSRPLLDKWFKPQQSATNFLPDDSLPKDPCWHPTSALRAELVRFTNEISELYCTVASQSKEAGSKSERQAIFKDVMYTSSEPRLRKCQERIVKLLCEQDLCEWLFHYNEELGYSKAKNLTLKQKQVELFQYLSKQIQRIAKDLSSEVADELTIDPSPQNILAKAQASKEEKDFDNASRWTQEAVFTAEGPVEQAKALLELSKLYYTSPAGGEKEDDSQDMKLDPEEYGRHCIREALSKDPHGFHTRMAHTMALLKDDRVEEAEQVAKSIKETHPDDLLTKAIWALVEHFMEETDKAATLFHDMAAEFGYPGAYITFVDHLRAFGFVDMSQAVIECYALNDVHEEEQEEYELATESMVSMTVIQENSSLVINPAKRKKKDVRLFVLNARLEMDKGDLEKALKWLEKAIYENDEYPEAWAQLGELYHEQGDFIHGQQADRRYIKELKHGQEKDINVVKRLKLYNERKVPD